MSRLTDYRNSRPPSRPDSANLVDLHVYIVPPDIWRDRFNNLLNQSVSETVSIGIIRVSPDIKLTDIRDELPRQLEDLVPSDFIFLRSVGRSLTRLKPKQEFQLKAKHFLPPVAYAPELYLLEATADIRASLTSDGSSRSQSYNRLAGDESQRGFHSYRDGPGGPYDDRYTQTKINEQPNEEHGGKRQNRGNKSYRDPASHYTPLPRIESRAGSRLDTSGEYTHDSHKYTPRQAYSRQSKLADREYTHRQGRRDRHDNENQDDENTLHPEYNNQLQNKRSHRNRHRYSDQPQSDDERQAYEKDGRTQYYKTPRTRRQTDTQVDDDDYFSDSKTPPHSPGRPVPYSHTKGQGHGHHDPHSSPNTNHTNEDSGFAGLSPDERERDNYLEDYERKANASNRRKAGDNDDNKKQNQGKGRNSDNDKLRRADEDRKKYGGKSQAADDKSERNRSRYGDNDDRLTNGNDTDHSRWDDEDADSRKYRDSENDDNDSKRYRDNDNDRDSRRRSGSAGDDGFPTPPPLEMKSPREERDTDSAYGRRRDEKERLLAELDEARESRKSAEQDREELVKRAKQLQHKTTNRRNNARPLHEDREARDVWKKRYFEEKKITAPLEDSTNRLRHELEVLHRKLMTTLEGPKDGKPVKYVDGKPSPKNNYIIQCTRLQHEIEDLRRRSENAKMKLTAEMKLRTSAESELRSVRANRIRRKINTGGSAFTQVY